MPIVQQQSIDARELDAAIRQGRRPLLVDVCSPGEFAAGHLPGAVNIPLEQMVGRVRDISWSSETVLLCKSGHRAGVAQESLRALGLNSRVLRGGIGSWSREALPLVRSASSGWALERQVRLVAGVMGFTGVVLALFSSNVWLVLPGIAGLGLMLAGFTGLCPMASLLARMPWNRPRTGEQSAVRDICSM